MGQVTRALRRMTDGYSHWCPGCLEMHAIRTDGPRRPCWTFDGNLHAPTFGPSVLITGKQTVNVKGEWTGEWVMGPDDKALDMVCHYFLIAGRLNYLADCTHALKGQNIELPDLPQWMVDNHEGTDMADEKDVMTDSDRQYGAADQSQGSVDTLELKIDTADMVKMTAELKAHIDSGFEAVRGEFRDELTQFADHFEKKLESVLQGIDGLDPAKIEEVLAAIKDSGGADLNKRLTKLEMSLRHSL